MVLMDPRILSPLRLPIPPRAQPQHTILTAQKPKKTGQPPTVATFFSINP